ncbi:MAG TPA: DinB family protein [Candidatus Binatus sp.]|nr:DinB family protein [Candidatus Binatus sp.]
MTRPDPAPEAKAYQDALLAALGDDDPADAQAGTPERIRRLIAEAGDDLRVRPQPGEWSVLECIGHLVDDETVLSARYRWVLAQDEPQLNGFDQDAWVEGLRHNDDEPDALLASFAAMRSANVALWRRSSPAQRARVAIHSERGRESFELMFRMLAGHDRVHLDQAERALASVRGRGR